MIGPSPRSSASQPVADGMDLYLLKNLQTTLLQKLRIYAHTSFSFRMDSPPNSAYVYLCFELIIYLIRQPILSLFQAIILNPKVVPTPSHYLAKKKPPKKKHFPLLYLPSVLIF